MALRRTHAITASLLAALPVSSQQDPEPALEMVLTGDSIITRKLSVYREPEFLGMVEMIRAADVAFTNLEVLFHDYEPYPMHESGGTWMRADPALAEELAWAGFDLVARANNHAGDYGVRGMRLTSRYVKAAGLVEAGVGDSLAEAREAKFFDTHAGRVALISVASTFPDHSRAGRSRDDVPARPGLSPLRFTRYREVTAEQMRGLRAALREAGLEVAAEGDTLRFSDTRFVVGEQPRSRSQPDAGDLEEIGAVVRSAAAQADYTILSLHAHEGGGSRFVPAEFVETFARAMVEAGADVVVGHGPHVLRGIEVYRGKPILYSLGDFIFQNETLLRLPAENYEEFGLDDRKQVGDFNDARYDEDRRGFPARREVWEAVIARLRWRGGGLVALELHPISLGFGQPRTQRGRPRLAAPELAGEILDGLAELSAPYGTVIRRRDGIGIVELR